jgi:hypothetical protein
VQGCPSKVVGAVLLRAALQEQLAHLHEAAPPPEN